MKYNILLTIIFYTIFSVIFCQKSLPSSFLSPPGLSDTNIDPSANDWLEQEEGFKELEVADDEEEEGTKRGISILNKSLLSARKRLELEAQKISVKAKSTLERIKQFTNKTLTGNSCQSAADCKTNQVCFLPTNTCKDQLSFSLKERTASCSSKDDCNENEVCYLPDQKCVCDLTSIEQLGSCIKIQNLTCTDSISLTKIKDDSNWGVSPYCLAWGNDTINGDEFTGMLSYGEYDHGTGVDGEPMVFLGGSDVSCKHKRSSRVYYECYCEEFDCEEETPEYNSTSLWWGEFDPCVYTAYIFTPLACDDLVE